MTALPKIVIVDDDRDLRDIYVQKFRASGFEVLAARDGQEGLDLAKKVKPDLILTGITMPKLTGFEMARLLKGDPVTSAIPVVVFSHRGLEEDKQRARELGAAAFLVQGRVTPDEVVSVVQGILRGAAYRVTVNIHELDGARLAADLKTTGRVVLELRRNEQAGPDDFTAQVVSPAARP